MTDQLVVARYRGTQNAPKFTRPSTVDELLKEVVERIPVDLVYFLVPHPDGKGYSFREAGLVTLDILSEGYQHPTPLLTPPAPFLSHSEPAGINVKQTSPTLPQPLDNPTDPSGYAFGQDLDLKLLPTKTQRELLAERGLELPPKSSKVAPGSPKKKRSKGKPTPSITEADIDASGPLLHPVSNGSRVEITSISQATQAEAAAASKQIFK